MIIDFGCCLFCDLAFASCCLNRAGECFLVAADCCVCLGACHHSRGSQITNNCQLKQLPALTNLLLGSFLMYLPTSAPCLLFIFVACACLVHASDNEFSTTQLFAHRKAQISAATICSNNMQQSVAILVQVGLLRIQ